MNNIDYLEIRYPKGIPPLKYLSSPTYQLTKKVGQKLSISQTEITSHHTKKQQPFPFITYSFSIIHRFIHIKHHSFDANVHAIHWLFCTFMDSFCLLAIFVANQIPMNSRPRRRTLLHFALLSSRHAANLRKYRTSWGRLFVSDTTAWINPLQTNVQISTKNRQIWHNSSFFSGASY